jgi:hypothetical protein
VQGQEAACRGSDGEPILEIDSLVVAKDITAREDVLTSFHERNRSRLSELSHQTKIPAVELFALLIGLH